LSPLEKEIDYEKAQFGRQKHATVQPSGSTQGPEKVPETGVSKTQKALP